VRDPDSEGVANHTVPESCVGCREAPYEALTGVRVGQPLSHESHFSGVPTLLLKRKATRTGTLQRAPGRPRAVRDPGMHGSSLHGNREISRLANCCAGLVRAGKARSRSR
jgi:hypothetical protein